MKSHLIQEIHEHLNMIWKKAINVSAILEKGGYNFRLEPVRGNYIKLNDRWEKQEYPICEIDFDKNYSIGFNLDSIFLLFWSVRKDFFSESVLQSLASINPAFEIYGAKDFFNTFYSKGIEFKDFEKKLAVSNEEILQFSHFIEYCETEETIIGRFLGYLKIFGY